MGDAISLQSNPLYKNLELVREGTMTYPSLTLNTGGANYGGSFITQVSFNHGLNFTPILVASVQISGSSSYVPLPYTDFGIVTSTGFCNFTKGIYTNSQHVNLFENAWGYNINTTIPGATVKFYLLRATANQ